MVKKLQLFLLFLTLPWAFMPLQAVVTPRAAACQELVSFQKLVKQSLVLYRAGQNEGSGDAQESQLAEFVAQGMPYAHQHMSEQDLRNLHVAAAHLDTILSNPLSDRVVREKAITNISRTLIDQSSEQLCKMGALSKHSERAVPVQLSARQKKLAESEQDEVVNRAQPAAQRSVEASHADDEQVPQEGADIITWLTNNPEKVALGVAAVYGLLARYFEWPPFNKKDSAEIPAQPAQAPAAPVAEPAPQAAPENGAVREDEEATGILGQVLGWFASE